ncbi:pilus assembly protein TadG-related protein [Alcanivorax quisquiliarum]|uniref:Putative Flp pilus-assembly TadG-like N-terminal domain-containing protein n=1 Tax=Alcanivorax quisquiliarum TaxID=2933565 RepID=A0ABT0E582_9GAMM|nr:pilus assembly protein TadG-related protein [Alcanivorax quisquiliarum]MCK0536990.1 hypothetical protein [Alcanivorax quisquiliarum]
MKNRVRIAALSKQRGALTVTTPLLVILIFLLVALMFDGARLFAHKREMQAVANAAATAAAGAAQACGGESVSQQLIEIAAKAAAEEQGARGLGGRLSLIQAGTFEPNEHREYRFSPIVNTVFESNAVKVVYEAEQPISLMLPTVFGTITLKAVAVARNEVIATVSASGSTAVLGGSEGNAGLLGDLLGALLTDEGPLRLDATEVKSLANSTFLIGKFLKRLPGIDLVNVVDSVIEADDFIAAILSGLGEQSSQAGVVLDDILKQSTLINTNIRLGDVLNLVGDVKALEQARVPVYDTLIALGLNLLDGKVLNIESPINIDLDVGDLVAASVSVSVGQPPSVVVGPARFDPSGAPMVEFHAADIILGLTVKANLLGLADLEIPLLAQVGGGGGYLAYADCASGDSNDVLLGFMLQTNVLELSTQKLTNSGAPSPSAISATVLPAVSSALPVLRLKIELPGIKIGQPKSVQDEMTFNLHERKIKTLEVGSNLEIYSLDDKLLFTELDFTLAEPEDCGFLGLGCVLGPILKPILDLLGEAIELTDALLQSAALQLINSVLNDVLKPVLKGLGVNLGGMSVEVSYASQSGVSLVDCSVLQCDQTVLE